MPVAADSMFILADDLSGAADCALGAAKAGLKSIVLFEHGATVQAQVVAVDANTRHRSCIDAGAINQRLWQAHSAPERLFYKKIDSTLRGNFACEMAALVGTGLAIVAPAFPATGRTTRDGDLVRILRAQGLDTVNIPLATVRGDLRAKLSRLIAERKVQAVVCDAGEDSDLARIAEDSVGLPVYWVGSAGLAAHLPGAAGLAGHAGVPDVDVSGAIVTVVGSLSTASRQQAEVLAAETGMQVFVVPPAVLRAGETDARWQELRDALGATLRAGGDALIRTGHDSTDDLAQGHVLCESLARLLAPFADAIGALVATGGETARVLLPAFGAHALHLVR